MRIARTASHEPLATNHYAPPARIATCVFGVSPDLYIADRDEGVFVPQTLRFGGLWLGVAVYCRSGQDAGVELESSRDRQRWPKVYIADFTWGNTALNKRKLPYAIIDGKQRFEAIFGFYVGDFVLNDDFIYLQNPHLKLGGLGYATLRSSYPDIAEEFDNFTLSVMSVITDNEASINELFVRLNRSKPLTGAEIRNAMVGPAPGIFRQIANHEFFREYVRFKVTRGQDLNAAAKLSVFEYNDKVMETKKRNLEAVSKLDLIQ